MKIISSLPTEEEEKVIITKEDLIVFPVGDLDTKLQIVDSNFKTTTILKQMLYRIITRIVVRMLIIQKVYFWQVVMLQKIKISCI